MKCRELTVDLLKKALTYDHLTGIFTRLSSGKTVGTPDPNGYMIINLYGKTYLAHRLAWLYTHGCYPKNQIDHINGTPQDNRLVNLRDATPLENRWNERKRKNNTSGYKNVCFHNGPNRTKPWRVVVRLGGRLTTAGYFHTKEEASEAAKKWREAHHGEFANHG